MQEATPGPACRHVVFLCGKRIVIRTKAEIDSAIS